MDGPDWDNYEYQKIIGRGAQGCAYLCKQKQTLEEVVVKTVFIRDQTNEEIEKAMLEVSILSNLANENVVRYIDYFIDAEGMLCMVIEYAAGGDLASVIKEHTYEKTVPPDDIAIDVGRQMLGALKYLRTMRVMHRDLKPANILIGQDGLLKLTDFGVARLLDLDQAGAQTFTGTPFYISPELCLGEPYGFGADVWSLGVTLYEVSTLTHPFKGSNLLAIVNSITDGVYEPMVNRSAILVELVAELLTADPTERKTAGQLLALFFPADAGLGHLYHTSSFNKSAGIPAVQLGGSAAFSPTAKASAAPSPSFGNFPSISAGSLGGGGGAGSPGLAPSPRKPTPNPTHPINISGDHAPCSEERRGSVMSEYSDPGLHEYISTVKRAKLDGQATIFGEETIAGGGGNAPPTSPADPTSAEEYEDDFYEYMPSPAAPPNLKWMNNMHDGDLEHKIRAKAEALQRKRLIIYEKRKKMRGAVPLNPAQVVPCGLPPVAGSSPSATNSTPPSNKTPADTISPPARVKARFLATVSQRTAKEKGVRVKATPTRHISSSPNYDSDSGTDDDAGVIGDFNTTSGRDAMKSVKRLMAETLKTRAELGIDSESSSTTDSDEEHEEQEEGEEDDRASSDLDQDLVHVRLIHADADGGTSDKHLKNLPAGGELKRISCGVADWLPGRDADAHLYWEDSDGDRVRILTQEDMAHAIESFWQGMSQFLDVYVMC